MACCLHIPYQNGVCLDQYPPPPFIAAGLFQCLIIDITIDDLVLINFTKPVTPKPACGVHWENDLQSQLRIIICYIYVEPLEQSICNQWLVLIQTHTVLFVWNVGPSWAIVPLGLYLMFLSASTAIYKSLCRKMAWSSNRNWNHAH